MASSRLRETEHQSASACSYVQGSIIVTKEDGKGWWNENDNIDKNDNNNDDDDIDNNITTKENVPCVSLQEGTTIRIAPMERKCGGWDEEHFHDKLKLPHGSDFGRGMVVTLEAMGRECVAVALSPTPNFTLGKTYVVHFGAAGNLTTVLRRRLPNGTEAVDAAFPSRVCATDKWTFYWVCLQSGVLSAGVGRVPGKQCIGTLDDTFYNQLRSGVDAVRYVGIGNSALGRMARDVRVRNVRVTPIPDVFGIKGIPMEVIKPDDNVGFVSVEALSSMSASDVAVSSGTGPSDAELLAEYERECAKARARAAKFGTVYHEPKPDAFLKWSEARRLRANPEKGFITGIDLTSREEQEKIRARKERFADDGERRRRKRKMGSDEEEDDDAMEGHEDDEDLAVDEEDRRDPLPVEQAWDNEELVREHRLDPPSKFFVKKSCEEQQEEPADDKRTDPSGGESAKESFGGNKENDAVSVPEKIHLSAIDWAAFKQIRTPDIMAYFSVYGPSYVEWLGELSCNVLFEDKYSAARAMTSLSQEIPSPPPESVSATFSNIDNDDEHPSPPPPDLGKMGWRFCRFPLRKIANDRFGRRGTTSRVLMREATSLDVLEERPTTWPRPPPGFTTKRVLGPGSDFDTRDRRGGTRRSTKRRKRGQRRRHDKGGKGENDSADACDMDDSNAEHPALSKGLRSSRPGFSVEELEAERMAKAGAAGD